jgi:hypothetical protein
LPAITAVNSVPVTSESSPKVIENNTIQITHTAQPINFYETEKKNIKNGWPQKPVFADHLPSQTLLARKLGEKWDLFDDIFSVSHGHFLASVWSLKVSVNGSVTLCINLSSLKVSGRL